MSDEIEGIRRAHIADPDGDPNDPHCVMCSDASYPIWPCDAALLLALLAERDAELEGAYWTGDESSPGGRIYCRGCGRSRATRLFRAHADVCWVGAALAARGGEDTTA